MQEIARARCFDGEQLRLQHRAETLSCDMTVSVFLPPQAGERKVPAIYWLSGLTCTDENFVTKAGAQRYAAEHGVALIAPDTSPRGDAVPDDPDSDWDFGHGAGFYVNATQEPWSTHYRMYDYVLEELPALIAGSFPINPLAASLMGHSMGGHGALVIGLRNPERWQSLSAFSPIVAPSQCPWGEKALGRYLGAGRDAWRDYDASALIEDGAPQMPLRIDQGTADNFLETQLKTKVFEAACESRGYEAAINYREGYDHSYYFIASFIGEHIGFHATHLRGSD
jgi:S-formylglutathione hydrolase